MANQDRATIMRTLYNLKMLYTGCFTKEAISLFLSRSTENFKKIDFYISTLD